MKKKRVQAILDGTVSAEKLTVEEVEEFRVAVELAVMEKAMEHLLSEGKMVLWDYEPAVH